MRIAAIGRTRMLYDAIELVAENGYDVPIVVTYESQQEYRIDSSEFEQLAKEIGAEFYHTLEVDTPEFRSKVMKTNCDIGISVNWVTVLSDKFLNLFDQGVLNAHAGDLPRYRGNAAPNWAILNDEEEVVLSIHKMAPELDAGPILRQESKLLTPDTTIGEIYDWLHQVVPMLFRESIDEISSGRGNAISQSDIETTVLRTYPRKPKDSEINWDRSAEYLDRLVRASSDPLFGAFTYRGTNKLRIWDSHPENPDFEFLGIPGQVAERRVEKGEVAVITGDGFLVLEELQLEGGDRKAATEVIESSRTRLGMDIQSEIRRLKDEIE